MPGYDGGLRQEFRLEAYEVLTGNLRVNASSISADVPIFRIAVSDLLPATHFYLVTYAVNAKGRSEVSLLEDIMLRDSEKHTGIAQIRRSTLFTLHSVSKPLKYTTEIRSRRQRSEHGTPNFASHRLPNGVRCHRTLGDADDVPTKGHHFSGTYRTLYEATDNHTARFKEQLDARRYTRGSHLLRRVHAETSYGLRAQQSARHHTVTAR